MSTSGEAAIRAALQASGGRFAEAGCAMPPDLLDDVVLCLALRTGTAWRVDAAMIVLEQLQRRLSPSPAVSADVHTGLHEGITNAIVHGNLGVSSAGRDSLQGLAAYYEQIEAALARPELAQRRVLVMARRDMPCSLRIEVSDEGDGFAPSQVFGAGPALLQPHGRGIALICAAATECRWLGTPRTLLMRFRLDEEARRKC